MSDLGLDDSVSYSLHIYQLRESVFFGKIVVSRESGQLQQNHLLDTTGQLHIMNSQQSSLDA